MMNVSTRHEPTPCPYCGYTLDSATDAKGQPAQLKEGDWSVCFECGGELRFGADLKPRVPTTEEWQKVPMETVNLLSDAQQALVPIWREKNEKVRK